MWRWVVADGVAQEPLTTRFPIYGGCTIKGQTLFIADESQLLSTMCIVYSASRYTTTRRMSLRTIVVTIDNGRR